MRPIKQQQRSWPVDTRLNASCTRARLGSRCRSRECHPPQMTFMKLTVDCLHRTRVGHIHGFAFPSLADEDAFLLQVLHAFRHFLSSWLRLSWLWEIHYFLASR